MDVSNAMWSTVDYCMKQNLTAPTQLGQISAAVYERVCRTNFASPGFCVLDLGPDITSSTLRRTMLEVRRLMHAIHRDRHGFGLVVMSAARFDQQVTTRPHRDGGPDQSFLTLCPRRGR